MALLPQRHLLHSSNFPQAMKQCPIKRALHRSADMVITCAVLQSLLQGCSGCTAIPSSLHRLREDVWTMMAESSRDNKILPASFSYVLSTQLQYNFLNSFCKSKLKRKETVYQHGPSQPTLAGHLTSRPRPFAPLCSTSKMPNLCHTGDGLNCCLPTIT